MKNFLIFLMLFLSFSSWAFDCKKAKTATEKAICKNHNLIAYDNEMNLVYNEYMQSVTENERKNLRETQKSWIIKRETDCAADPICIKGWTNANTVKFKYLLYKNENKSLSDDWEGEWSWTSPKDSFPSVFSGVIDIRKCDKKSCEFVLEEADISSICSAEGKIQISNNKAIFLEDIDSEADPESESIQDQKQCKITFILDKTLRTLGISDYSNCDDMCGHKGFRAADFHRRSYCFIED